ncbi:MAG: hypothetical protein ACEQSQ_06075 [Candidatus Paceibacteria bacterium]
MNNECPHCGNRENFHYNYDYGKNKISIIDILCNECGNIFNKNKSMNKQEWIKAKQEKKFTLELLYEFWQDNKKPTYKEVSFEDFSQLIQVFINNQGVLSHTKLLDHFDEKFKITKVFNNKGQIVKEF